jgi:hypothetical protein
MQLEREIRIYRESLPGLAQHEGKYVLIHLDHVIGTFSSYGEALRQGYSDFGLQPFLVKRIAQVEPMHFIPRLILPIRVTRAPHPHP